jgi:hypothetical protein
MGPGKGRLQRDPFILKSEKTMKVNRYFWVVFLYFFINPLGLSWGLTWTTLLTPLLYYWVAVTRKKEIFLPFLLVLTPFFIIQYLNGIVLGNYVLSLLNMAAVYVFCQAVYTFLRTAQDPEKIFRKILIWNFALCILAIPFYFYHPFKDFIWISQVYTSGVSNFLRLKGFTYEASDYATLFTPFFLFFFWQIILRQNKVNVLLLSMLLFIPFLFSFSLGVIGALVMAICITYMVYFKTLTLNRRVLKGIAISSILLIAALSVLSVFFPDNAIFVRVGNILSGNDISDRARTSDAFYLADKILNKKNEWWGIGPGQLKLLGTNMIMQYYGYTPDFDKGLISIPNAVAETLVNFGWIGIMIRFLAEGLLFAYTRVWNNYFRLTLFLFMFIYQFTGSFITSTAEYVIWILAFTNAFPRFDVDLPEFKIPELKIRPADARMQNL